MVLDFPSLLGNREALQSGFNFENCTIPNIKKSERLRRLPTIEVFNEDDGVSEGRVPINSLKYKKISQLLDSEDYLKYLDENDEFGICLEGAPLSVEFLLTRKTFFPDCESLPEQNYLKCYEEKFKEHVLPKLISKKVFVGDARCEEYVVEIEDKDISPIYFAGCEINYIFNLKNNLDPDGEQAQNPSKVFRNFDENKHEIWVRVWYKQIYDAFTQDNVDLISDECLVHVAAELGVKNASNVCVRKLFDYCRDEFMSRYYL